MSRPGVASAPASHDVPDAHGHPAGGPVEHEAARVAHPGGHTAQDPAGRVNLDRLTDRGAHRPVVGHQPGAVDAKASGRRRHAIDQTGEHLPVGRRGPVHQLGDGDGPLQNVSVSTTADRGEIETDAGDHSDRAVAADGGRLDQDSGELAPAAIDGDDEIVGPPKPDGRVEVELVEGGDGGQPDCEWHER